MGVATVVDGDRLAQALTPNEVEAQRRAGRHRQASRVEVPADVPLVGALLRHADRDLAGRRAPAGVERQQIALDEPRLDDGEVHAEADTGLVAGAVEAGEVRVQPVRHVGVGRIVGLLEREALGGLVGDRHPGAEAVHLDPCTGDLVGAVRQLVGEEDLEAAAEAGRKRGHCIVGECVDIDADDCDVSARLVRNAEVLVEEPLQSEVVVG